MKWGWRRRHSSQRVTPADLWIFENRHRRQAVDGASRPLEYLGLYPVEDVRSCRYWCTPLNCRTFAMTRGDGDHFGILNATDDQTDGPVVVSAPSNGDRCHLIAGETLYEFLCLGYHAGYMGMGELASSWRDEPESIEGDESDLDEEDARMLRRLRRQFGLRPWQEVQKRLEVLQSRYLPLLVLDTTDCIDPSALDEIRRLQRSYRQLGDGGKS